MKDAEPAGVTARHVLRAEEALVLRRAAEILLRRRPAKTRFQRWTGQVTETDITIRRLLRAADETEGEL